MKRRIYSEHDGWRVLARDGTQACQDRAAHRRADADADCAYCEKHWPDDGPYRVVPVYANPKRKAKS